MISSPTQAGLGARKRGYIARCNLWSQRGFRVKPQGENAGRFALYLNPRISYKSPPFFGAIPLGSAERAVRKCRSVVASRGSRIVLDGVVFSHAQTMAMGGYGGWRRGGGRIVRRGP